MNAQPNVAVEGDFRYTAGDDFPCRVGRVMGHTNRLRVVMRQTCCQGVEDRGEVNFHSERDELVYEKQAGRHDCGRLC